MEHDRLYFTGQSGFVGSNIIEDLREHYTISDHHFDYIVNLASISSVEYSIKHPLEVIENNIMHTTQLLERARLKPPKLFVQFSTIESQNITNPYAGSKKAQEALALAYSRTYDIPVVVVHSTNIVGPNQSKDKFLPKIVDQIKANEPVTIYTHNGEMAERTYNPVKNIGSAILYLLQHYEDYQTYNEVGIEGGETLNNLQLAQRVARILGKELTCRFVEVETIRPDYLMGYTPENGIEGWLAPQTLDEGLQCVLD
jgi:dTDP-glucose 4,6-dehydratase